MLDSVHLKASKRRIRLRPRYVLLAVVLLAVVAGAGAGVYLWQRGGGQTVRVVTAVRITYPAGWSEQPLSDADRNAGLMVKLERQGPAASFLARTVIARLAPDFDINQLASQTQAALSSGIQNVDLLSNSVSAIGPYNAVKIYYRQAGQAGAADYQTLVAVIPTANQTFYLTFRAQKSDFSKIEDEGLQIAGDFANFVSANQ